MKHVTYVLLLFYVFVCLFGCDKEPLTKKTGLIIKKWDEPVLKRDKGLLSDPTVIRQGDSLVMYYTNFSLDTDSITFGGSTSQDGISWSPISQKPSFRVFSGDTNSWDKHIETPEAVDVNNQIYLYYIGYPDSEDFTRGIYESEVGMAISNSIERFSRFQKSPVVMRNGQYDADAITSPAVVYYDHTYFMIYTGWSNILEPGGFLGLTGAVSTDGIHWIKHKTPIFTEVNNTDFETATEADIVFGPDKMFYLIFSAEGGIALARSAHPFGPWDIYPSYIITSEYQWESGEVVAPEMIIENEKAKIWYTGVVGSFAGSSIGYVEINFPFEWP